jgi:predicted RNase H-like HicB family nuclease
MLITYTAKYTKLENGYMGQLLEWPEVITEGKTLEDCRSMLKDALQGMIAAYKELKMEIPRTGCLMEHPDNQRNVRQFNKKNGFFRN